VSQAQIAQEIRTGQYVPDILDCLAQLSNDEVPTPPKLARAMLDILPDEVWSNPDYKWLDPFCKSGIFLREIAARLIDGLAEAIPDFTERREHIYRNMLYGTSITEMTGQISRRSLYYSRDASGDHSVVHFDDSNGNLPFIRADHTFKKKQDGTVDGGCVHCGAPLELERGEGRENYAYSFIHGAYPTEELKDMKFDVIVGNPPFQVNDGGGGGGASSVPLYNLFVEHAKSLQPRHIVMITPSRWFSGGKGLDDFRDRMLADKHITKMVDHPRLYDCFPGVKIRGGVSYWHWDSAHSGPCEVVTKVGDEVLGAPAVRNLDAYDVFLRRNEAVSILDKVDGHRESGVPDGKLGDQVSARRPFRLLSDTGQQTPEGLEDPILVYANQSTFYAERATVTFNDAWVDRWKVLLVKAHGTSGQEDVTILGHPVIAGPGSACTETYLVVGTFNSRLEAERLAAYMRTRFVRFLVSLRKITQNITRDSYRFVPALPMDREWSEADLYERYGLDESEVAFIESHIAQRLPDGTVLKPTAVEAVEDMHLDD
jgi:site-specific DNA-methyltransferase (adenine-specific)